MKIDPEVSLKTISSIRATIEKYQSGELAIADRERNLIYEQYTIKLETGKTVTYIFAPDSDIGENLKKINKPFINRIGFLP